MDYNKEKVAELYKLITDNGGNVGASVEEFATKLQDSAKRQKVYDLLTSNGAKVGDFDNFSTKLGYGVTLAPTVAPNEPKLTATPTPKQTPLVLRPEEQTKPKAWTGEAQDFNTAFAGRDLEQKPRVMPEMDMWTDDKFHAKPTLVPSEEHPAIPKRVAIDPKTGKQYDWDKPETQALVAEAVEQKNKHHKAIKVLQDGEFNLEADLREIGNQLEIEGKRVDAEAKKERDKAPWFANIPTSRDPLAPSVADLREKGAKDFDPEYQRWFAAKSSLQDAKERLAEAKVSKQDGNSLWAFAKGAGRGFKNKLFDARTWDSGKTDIAANAALLSAVTKWEKGEALTKGEQALLDAKATEMAVDAYTHSDIGKGYVAGEITAHAIPFMLEMMVNPLSKVGTTIGSRLTRYAFKRFAQKGLSKFGAKAIGVAGRVAGDALGAAGMAATTGAVGVGADALDRMTGDVEYRVDHNGDIRFKGIEAGSREEMGTAIAKAFGARTIENHSEMVGAYFAPVLGQVGKLLGKTGSKLASTSVGKALGKAATATGDFVGKTKIGRAVGKVDDVIKRIHNSPWAKEMNRFTEHTQWHGSIEEFAEEIVGGIENAILVGDQTLDTNKQTGVFNADNMLQTFLGVSLMGGFMTGVKVAGYRTERYEARKASEDLAKQAEATFENKEAWQTVRQQIDNQDYTPIVRGTFTPEERKAIIMYASARERLNGIEVAETERADQSRTGLYLGLRQSHEEGQMAFATPVVDEAGNEQFDYQGFAELRKAQDILRDEAKVLIGIPQDAEGGALFAEDSEAALRAGEAFLSDPNQSEEAKAKVREYLHAKARWDGVRYAQEQAIKHRLESMRADVKDIMHSERGIIQPVRIDGREHQGDVFLRAGEIVHHADGSINREQSTQSVTVYNQATGEVEMLPIEDIAEAGQAEDIEQTLQSYAQYYHERFDELTQYEVAEASASEVTNNSEVSSIEAQAEATEQASQERNEPEFALNDVLLIRTADGGSAYVEVSEELGDNGKIQLTVKDEEKRGRQIFSTNASVAQFTPEELRSMVISRVPREEAPEASTNADVLNGQEPMYLNDQGQSSTPTNAEVVPFVGRSMTQEEALSFVDTITTRAEEAPELELTPENWVAEFGEEGRIATPMGMVKMGENQYFKLAQQGRNGKLGMIKPTLTNPDVILEDGSTAEGEEERESSYVFIKAFTGKNGERVYYFTSITVQSDGQKVVISNQEKRANKISKLLQNSVVAWINRGLHPSSQVEGSVPLNESNRSTSSDNQPAWHGINSSSTDKISKTFEESEWDALVEQAEGDRDLAQMTADNMVSQAQDAVTKAEKELKAKTKANAKPKTPAEMMQEMKERKAKLQAAEAELAKWQAIANVQANREAEVLRQKQDAQRLADEQAKQEAEALRAEAEARQAEEDRLARETAEQLNGVPEWHNDTPERARERGYRNVQGTEVVHRQDELGERAVWGNPLEVTFSNNDIVPAHFALLEASDVQPSHIQGKRNPHFFIDEAQPKDRREGDSVQAAQQIAKNLRPAEITGGVTAYGGSPVVNRRGEVVQGNGRSDALLYMYDKHPEQAKVYKQFLMDNAEQFGLQPEAIEAMERPILTKMLEVSDEEAIRLGNMTASDTESGGERRIEAIQTLTKMGKDTEQFMRMLFNSANEEASYSQLIEENGVTALKWLHQRGYISDTQYKSAVNSRGNLSEEGKSDFSKIVLHSIFQDADTTLKDSFASLPTKAQNAILATAYRDYSSPIGERVLVEVQDSMRAYYTLMQNEEFAKAKNIEQALQAVDAWLVQQEFDPNTGELYSPNERLNFSNFALHLAAKYRGNTQKALQADFNELYDLVQGIAEDTLFEEGDATPRTLKEAIKQVFNIDYNGNEHNGSDALDERTETSESRGQRSDSGTENRQQPTSRKGATQRRGRATSDAQVDRQGNPLNEDGSLKVEEVDSVEAITDADFEQATRNILLPILPKAVDIAIGAEGRRVVIKKNIFEKNKKSHKDLSPEQSREILQSALYNPDLYGQNQKASRPYNWIVINTTDAKGKNRLVLLEVSPNKEHLEIVHWHYLDGRGLEKIKRQAEREGGQLLILPSDIHSEEAGALSSRTLDLSSDNKGSENPATAKKATAAPRKRLVSEERYQELKERMKKKLLGQVNVGVDPEILSIGLEMSVYHLENGINKFTDYARTMIDELGDVVRPYLKAFYNGMRDLPEVQEVGLSDEMDSYEEVGKFDVANFDKPVQDILSQAEQVHNEQIIEKQVKEHSKKKKVSLGKEAKPIVNKVNTMDLFGALATKGAAKPSDFFETEANELDSVEAKQETTNEEVQGLVQRTTESRRTGHTTDTAQSLGGSQRNRTQDTQQVGVDRGRGGSTGDARVRGGGVVDEPKSQVSEKRNTRNNRNKAGVEVAPQSPETRFKANIEAIRTLKRLQENGEVATPEDMEILRRFSGWGGLGTYFDWTGQNWVDNPKTIAKKELKELLTDEEYDAANLSRNSAYFTPTAIIEQLWSVVEQLGFKGGKILEGSAGVGSILGSMPQYISEHSSIEAVEIDPITGGMLELLYPDAKVHIQGFEDTKIADNSVDLAITNVPFVTGLSVFDKVDTDLSSKFRNIHDFAIAKNVRKLKQGGLGVFITSSGTLDKSHTLRRWLVDNKGGNADVVGAFRLNNETFGGTSVTSDIIVVRKRVGQQKSPNAIDVQHIATAKVIPYENPQTNKTEHKSLDYNAYFHNHPEYMGGEMAFGFQKGETYRPTSVGLYPIKGDEGQSKLLAEWVKSLNEEVASQVDEVVEPTIHERTEVAEGRILLDSQGRISISQGGEAVPLSLDNRKVKGHSKEELVKDYLSLKEAYDALIDYQLNYSDINLQAYLDKFNEVYDHFVGRYGMLNHNTAISMLKQDVDFAGLASIEKVYAKRDASGKKVYTAEKREVFSQRVVNLRTELTPSNMQEAVVASIHQHGGIDLSYIKNELGLSPEQITAEIISTGLGFENPVSGHLEVRHDYLSGNIREKLALAKAKNENGRYSANIEALEQVLPMEIPAHLIKATLGSTWMPGEVYQDFFRDKFGVQIDKPKFVAGQWRFSDFVPGSRSDQNKSAGVYSERFSEYVLGHQLAQKAMEGVSFQFSHQQKNYATGKSETIHDREATQRAVQRIAEIQEEFKDWFRDKLNTDTVLSEHIVRIYNDKHNNYVPLKVDERFYPENKQFEGMNTKFRLLEHQMQGAMRGVMQPLMLAHEVGSGKTFTLIATAMEMRRLGSAKKPMIVVQNSTVGQFVESAKDLYPNAKILTIDPKERTPEGRRAFYGKIKNSDWDLIVVPQSVFNMIPDHPRRQEAFIDERIEEKERQLELAHEDKSNSHIARQLEGELKALNRQREAARLGGDNKQMQKSKSNAAAKAKQQAHRRTDDVSYFEDMGVDALLIDEAHNYKKLGFETSAFQIKGIDKARSQQAANLYIKTRTIFEQVGWRNVIFATGTPISNTAAELYTFMRYLMPPEIMEANGILHFDEFRKNFGEDTQGLEFTTAGKFKETTRFASYINLPELVRLWGTVSHTQLKSDSSELSEKQPETEEGGSKAKDIFIDQTPELVDVMRAVRSELEKFEQLSGAEKKANSHIPLTMFGIAQLAAIDVRLVDNNAEFNPNSKTGVAIEETLRSLEETKAYKGTVALFSDRFQNKKRLDNKGKPFNLFEDIKQRLIDRGVPEEQIVVMRSDMTDKQKLDIFERVNAGDVRVILGSTATLGVGVNIQERLHTLIHIDAPIRPMDYEQRNGRILRQGNLHKEWDKPVRLLRLGVRDTLDVTAYQRLKIKEAFIRSIMDGGKLLYNNQEVRTLEEEEEGTFDNPVAQLSGSEYALLRQQAERELRRLQGKLTQYEQDQKYISHQLKENSKLAERARAVIKRQEGVLALIEEVFPSGEFRQITFEGNKYKPEQLNEALKELANKPIAERRESLRANSSVTEDAMTFDFSVDGLEGQLKVHFTRTVEYKNGATIVKVSSKMSYSIPSLGIAGRPVSGGYAATAFKDISEEILSGNYANETITTNKVELDRIERDDKSMRQREGKPFEFDKDIQEAEQRLQELTELMRQELEAKEAKYANEGTGNSINLEGIEEDEANDADIRYRVTQILSEEDTDAHFAYAERATELGRELGVPVRIVEDIATLPKHARDAKGWFDTRTGEVVIVPQNASSMADVEETIYHEVVGHKGLRELIGAERFDAFLQEVYDNLPPRIKQAVAMDFATGEVRSLAEATEEHIARLAEQGFARERSLWRKIVDRLRALLREHFGAKLTFTENDLRYYLWRGYHLRQHQGIMQQAENIAMQQSLGVGRFRSAEGKTLQEANDRFNEQLEAFDRGDLKEPLNFGKPMGWLSRLSLPSEGDMLMSLKDLRKHLDKHHLTIEDIRNLPLALSEPLLAYEWGTKSPSLVVITSILRGEERIAVALRLSRGGDVMEVNEIASIHGKASERFLQEMMNAKAGGVKEALRLVPNKQKALDWLGLVPPKGTASLNNQELDYVAKVVKEFVNPSVEDLRQRKVYHGSPYLFEAFDHSHMGKGEGAQAYGWGTYVTEVDSIAKRYANDLSPRDVHILETSKLLEDEKEELRGMVKNFATSEDVVKEYSQTLLSGIKSTPLPANASEFAKEGEQTMIRRLEHIIEAIDNGDITIVLNNRNLYTVEVPDDDGTNYLHWERKISPDVLGKIYSQIRKYGAGLFDFDQDFWLGKGENSIGKNLYFTLSETLGGYKNASQFLANAGLVGISYPAEHQSGGREDGARNYVIFNEKDAPIIEHLRFRKAQKGVAGSARAEYNERTRRTNDKGEKSWRANFKHKLEEGHVDSMLSAKIAMEAILRESGKPLESFEDFYKGENALSSRNQGEMSIYERDFINPLFAEIQKLVAEGVPYKAIEHYVMAKHGLERNERMSREAAEREGTEYEVSDYSGLTAITGSEDNFTEIAEQMVADFERQHDTTALWERINGATKESLRKAYQSGMMTRATYNQWRDMYQHYVPLRGWAEVDKLEDMWDYLGESPNRSGNVMNKTAEGRKTEADNPFATIAYMGETAIRQGNRNKMKQQFLNFAMNHPTDLLHISKLWYVKDDAGDWHIRQPELSEAMTEEERSEELADFEARMQELAKEGKARSRTPGGAKVVGKTENIKNLEEHAVRVMRGGREYVVYVNGNPRLAQAVNGSITHALSNFSQSVAGQAIRKGNNWIASTATSYNPAFIAKNLVMDSIMANITLSIKEDAAYRKRFRQMMRSGIMGGTWGLIKRHEAGTLDMNNPIDRYFDEFIRNGGETGYTALNSVDDYAKTIEGLVKEAQGKGRNAVIKGGKALLSGVEFMNRVAEVNTRFAAYVASREAGRDVQRSVWDAKEITVNFNKKGSGAMGGSLMRGFYVFYNAGVQSMRQLYDLHQTNPRKFYAWGAKVSALGLIVPLLNTLLPMMLGDDDAEERYFGMNEYTRRNYILIYNPMSDEAYIKIPLPHPLRPLYGAGEQLFTALVGRQSMWQAMQGIAGGFTDLLPMNPAAGNGAVDSNTGRLDMAGIATNLAPTILQYPLQSWRNVDYFGQPLYRDTDYNKNAPEWTKARNANPALVEATRWLNELAGGDEVKSSGMFTDLNPELIEHFIESLTGGTGKFVNQVVKTIRMPFDKELREARNVPIGSTFYGNSRYGKRGILSNDYWDMRRDFEELKRQEREYRRGYEMSSSDKERANHIERWQDLMRSPEADQYRKLGKLVDNLGKLNKLKKQVKTDAELEHIEAEIDRGSSLLREHSGRKHPQWLNLKAWAKGGRSAVGL